MKLALESARLFFVLTIVIGVLYPLLCFGLGKLFFDDKINGSLIIKNGKLIGSSLIAQKIKDPKYFYSRPSFSDHETVPSGASNKGPTNRDLKNSIEQKRKIWQNETSEKNIPSDLLFFSGSGLDPHLSPEAVLFQVKRVALARNLSENKRIKLYAMIDSMIEQPTLGFIGKPRVNILLLNLKLSEL